MLLEKLNRDVRAVETEEVRSGASSIEDEAIVGAEDDADDSCCCGSDCCLRASWRRRDIVLRTKNDKD